MNGVLGGLYLSVGGFPVLYTYGMYRKASGSVVLLSQQQSTQPARGSVHMAPSRNRFPTVVLVLCTSYVIVVACDIVICDCIDTYGASYKEFSKETSRIESSDVELYGTWTGGGLRLVFVAIQLPLRHRCVYFSLSLQVTLSTQVHKDVSTTYEQASRVQGHRRKLIATDCDRSICNWSRLLLMYMYVYHIVGLLNT